MLSRFSETGGAANRESPRRLTLRAVQRLAVSGLAARDPVAWVKVLVVGDDELERGRLDHRARTR